jgi:hypothetical protein
VDPRYDEHMAKRKVTVTVDEELVELVQALGAESLSSVVNLALAAELERRARAAALARLLKEWEDAFGPVGPGAADAARVAFDDLDAVAVDDQHPKRRPRSRRKAGAA